MKKSLFDILKSGEKPENLGKTDPARIFFLILWALWLALLILHIAVPDDLNGAWTGRFPTRTSGLNMAIIYLILFVIVFFITRLLRKKAIKCPVFYGAASALMISTLLVQAAQLCEIGSISQFFAAREVSMPGMCFAAFFMWIVSAAIMLITGSTALGIALPAFFIIMAAVINHYKLIYLGIPLFPTDFALISNGLYLLKVIDKRILAISAAAVILIIACGIALGFIVPRIKGHVVKRLLTGVALIVVSLLIIFDVTGVRTNIFKTIGVFDRSANQVQNYRDNGILAGMLLNLESSVMDKPEGYGEDAMMKIASGYPALTASKDENPHIIYILSESFSDPYDLSEDFSVKNDPMPFIRSMSRESFKTTIMTPQIGSKTSNMEFELLASVGMRDIYQKSVLYQDNLQYKDSVWTMLSYLTKRGYEKTAIHPYNRTFYKRSEVYERMGFDRFMAEEDISSKDRLHGNPYIPDIAVYRDVVDIIKNSGAPQFFHIVSMQNHTPYYGGMYEAADFYIEGIEDAALRSEYEAYYQGIYYSDQALSWLVEALSALGERCIIVFYGDHQPYMAKMISSDEGAQDDPSVITEARYYKTPLVIIDTEKSSKSISDAEIMSPFYVTPLLFSYLGFELHPYYSFLLEMYEEMPVYERKFLMDKHGNELKSPDEEKKRIMEEYRLILYDMLEGKEFLNFYNNWK